MDWHKRFVRWPLPYDYKDAQAIEDYGKRLIDNTLRPFVPPESKLVKRDKGSFGLLLKSTTSSSFQMAPPRPTFQKPVLNSRAHHCAS